MSEAAKDPAIKLFGKTIQLPEITAPAADNRGVPPPPPIVLDEDLLSSPNSSRGESEKDALGEKLTDTKLEDGSQPLKSGEFTDPNASLATNENPKTPSVDNEASIVKNSKTEEEQSETNNSEEKTLKKPDKILPCPRCNSMETKFCYYNNYNVNQPRHFCKNCQRYWTAGGTMRSMPVGAGRRKNKNSSSLYRHITVSEALQSGQLNLPNGTHHPTMKANETVLTFGSNPPLCESMASVMKIAEKTMQNCSQNNGFHKLEELRKPVSYGNSDNGEDHSSESSVTATDSKDEVGGIGFPPQVPCFPGTPWPYAWNSIPWNSPVPPPAFFPPGFPMPFYPASPYWGCTVPGPWNVHWVAPPSTSGPNSPTLGKHARDENEIKSADLVEDEPQKENNPDKCLWFPKTLRIDDPEEAARSSIWATLGIKNDEAVSVRGGGLFKPFQSKGGEKNHISEASLVLQANPAALSRSLNFRESS